MAENNRYPAAFCAVVELAEAMGVTKINELSGCWEVQIDDDWHIALNGHRTPKRTESKTEVPSFSVYVEFNGWPAGVIDPTGGIIAAGERANEAAFIAAMKKRAAKERMPPDGVIDERCNNY